MGLTILARTMPCLIIFGPAASLMSGRSRLVWNHANELEAPRSQPAAAVTAELMQSPLRPSLMMLLFGLGGGLSRPGLIITQLAHQIGIGKGNGAAIGPMTSGATGKTGRGADEGLRSLHNASPFGTPFAYSRKPALGKVQRRTAFPVPRRHIRHKV